MKKRAVLIAAIVVLMLCVLAGVVIAATWKHWWWPVPSARVWIDGKPANDVQVFRSADGRYLLYRGERVMPGHPHPPGQTIQWTMDPAIVPGQYQPVDTTWVAEPFQSHWLDGDFVAFPFGVYSKDVPFNSDLMYQYPPDLKYFPHLVRQRHGFTFYIQMISTTIGPGWDRAVPCRLELP